mgnify:CR=1 FL=1
MPWYHNGDACWYIADNGASINYYYDNLDRIVSLRYNNNEQTAFNYTYNRFGSVSAITDTASGIAKIYDYDTVGRLISARTENGTNDVFRTHYTYDGLSRLDTLKYVYSTAAGTQYTHEYSATYGEDSRVNTFGLNGIFSITPTFDGLGRQSSRVLKNGSGAQVEKEAYIFTAGAGGANATTTLIDSVTYYGAGTTGTQYSYEYDKSGNLTKIKKGAATLHTYTYDSLGQLTSWYNAATNETTVYEYFKGGNIASIAKGDEVREFLYGINDQLTYYNEKFLTYDNVGNPLNYRDLIRLTWKNGRQMATFKLGDTLASYDYDENGIRTKKTVNGITTTFQLDGSKIVSENRNGTVQSYFYDENGSVLGITYGGENYYFRKNFRNDVLAILNASGEVVVEYSYDPWGNILAVTGSLASTLGADNPFRYRGYYYDTESCFYYLNSRYYDAKVCRYLNADSAIVEVGGSVQGYNLFAYCFNNPVNMSDSSGQWPQWIKNAASAVVNAVKKAAVTVVNTVKKAATTVVNAAKSVVSSDTNIVKASLNSLPSKGEPGSSQTLPNPDGTPKQKRWYGPDGSPERDRDYNHSGNMPFPHDHSWKNGERGKDHLPPDPSYKMNWESVIGVGLVAVCVVGIIAVAADDVSGIGVADDFLFGPLGAGIGKGLIMIFG